MPLFRCTRFAYSENYVYFCRRISNQHLYIMSKLGVIVSKRKIKNLPDFVENVTGAEELSKYRSEPTLLVGYEFLKENNIRFDILNKSDVANATMWTYSKTEKRDDYESDINYFIRSLIAKRLEKLQYQFIPLQKIIRDKDSKKAFYDLLNTPGQKYCYVNDRMMYAAIKDVSYGISLQLLEYLGVDKAKFEKYLRTIKDMTMVTDDDFDFGELMDDLKIPDMYKAFVYAEING